MRPEPNRQLFADAMDVVLNRLEAVRAGDAALVARIDREAPHTPDFLAALLAAAFAVAERSINVIGHLSPDELDVTLRSYRQQAEEYRRGA